MADRRPLVVGTPGLPAEVPSGDTLLLNVQGIKLGTHVLNYGYAAGPHTWGMSEFSGDVPVVNADVLNWGDDANPAKLRIPAFALEFGNPGQEARIESNLTAPREYQLRDADGVLALLADLPPSTSVVTGTTVPISLATGQFAANVTSGKIWVGDAGGSAVLVAELYGNAKTAFTPTIERSVFNGTPTYTTQIGFYEKIGKLVIFKLAVGLSAHTGGSGNMRVGGLPFTSANDGANTPVSVGFVSNLALGAGTILAVYVLPNSTQIILGTTPVGGGAAGAVALDTSFELQLSGAYWTP